MVIFIQDTNELAFPVALMQRAYESNVTFYHRNRTPLTILATIAKSQLPIERAAALTAIHDAITDDLPLYSESELRDAYTHLRQRYHESGEGLQAYGYIVTQRIGMAIAERRDKFTCPDCGGSLLTGVHQKQLDVDWFYCEVDDNRADYFEDDCVPF